MIDTKVELAKLMNSAASNPLHPVFYLVQATLALRDCVVRSKAGFAVNDHKAQQALKVANTALLALGLDHMKSVWDHDEDILPYPVASLVVFEDKLYLITDINTNVSEFRYHLMGHERLNTQNSARAWIGHSKLTMRAFPNRELWDWLKEARRQRYVG